MTTTEQIKQGLAKFSSKYGPAQIMQATVTGVNNDDTVSVILMDDTELEEVRLKSIVKNTDKILMIPAVGSIVQIARIADSHQFIVIAVEAVTKVIYKIGTVTFDVDANGFLLKKQNENLKTLIGDLITAITNAVFITSQGPTTGMLPATTTILNNIKTRFNSLLKSN